MTSQLSPGVHQGSLQGYNLNIMAVTHPDMQGPLQHANHRHVSSPPSEVKSDSSDPDLGSTSALPVIVYTAIQAFLIGCLTAALLLCAIRQELTVMQKEITHTHVHG